MSKLARLFRTLVLFGVLAAAVVGCAPGQPYVQTVDDENRLLYAPEASF